MKDGLITNNPPQRKWRCANGHEWESDRIQEMVFSRYSDNGNEVFSRRVPYCMECLVEQFAKIAVPIEELKEKT